MKIKKTEQLAGLRSKLIKNAEEAVLVSSMLNQRYISGFNYTDGYIFILKNKAYLLADFRYIEAARAEVSAEDFEIIMPDGAMFDELALLAEINSIKMIYIEDGTLCCAHLEKLRRRMPSIEFSSGATAVFSELRNVKSNWELEQIAKAQSIADRAFEHILGVIKPDMTEVDVALELEFYMRSHGAENVGFETIAVSGKASSLPHGVPRNVKLEKGFLTMDFGAKVEGYCSDMTRTVVIGKADDDMKKIYNTVLEAQRRALEMVAEGAACRDIDLVARNFIDDEGYKGCFGHGLGHGVGLFIHEPVRLSHMAPAEARLERGNVVTVEPGIYIEGKYGCRIEDIVAIDHSGNMINFTKSDKRLIEI